MRVHDPYRVHAWVNIAISILIRNVARAMFQVVLDGKPVTCGRVFELFRDVNPRMNRFDLWKETAGWWFLEGEAFWFFGERYSAGLPLELYVLNPRRMMAYAPFGTVEKWFYVTTKGTVPILTDEVIHFREWNPWNEIRGVNPLIALGEEIEQDVRCL